MKVTYIEHSSFLVEMESCYLLFDYFQGEIPGMDAGKELYVFVSHRHGDHFSPVIFELAGRYPTVSYTHLKRRKICQCLTPPAADVLWGR